MLPDALVYLDCLLQNSSDPFVAINAEGRIVFFNRAFVQLSGLTAAEVMAAAATPGAGTESARKLLEELQPPAEVGQGKVVTRPFFMVEPDGDSPLHSITFIPCTFAETVAAVIGRVGAPQPAAAHGEGISLRDRLTLQRQRLYARYRFDHVIAAEPKMLRVLEQTRLAATGDSPVLLQGERGTGKEHLARTIHAQGARREQRWLTLDCEVLPAALLDWHLGSGEAEPTTEPPLLSGTIGTVYLKEPARMPRDAQARFLELLKRPQAPRCIAGASTALEQAMHSGAVSDGFFYWLTPLTIELPPLRERPEDLGLLIQYLWQEKCGRPLPELDPAALESLITYSWPGNVDELVEAIVAANQACGQDRLRAEHLPLPLQSAAMLGAIPSRLPPEPLPMDQLLEMAERKLIARALEETRGNKSRAAARLEISRARLLRRMQQLQMDGATEAEAGEAGID